MDCKPGIFESLGVSSNVKKLLFYGICIWVRLFIAYLAYRYYSKQWFIYVAGLLSLYALLSIGSESCVWWSRSFHKVIAGLIFGSVALDQNKFVPYLLVTDVAFGLVYSIGRI